MNRIKFELDTLGITKESLDYLKKVIADGEFSFAVESHTGVITCGFFLYDVEIDQWYYSGDGFRSDCGGEGGRGYKDAIEIFEKEGIKVKKCDIPLIYGRDYSEGGIQNVLDRYRDDVLNLFKDLDRYRYDVLNFFKD